MEEIKKPALSIKVDDGTVRVPVTNEADQEIGYFTFRPTDMGIIERFNSIAGRFDEVTKPLKEIQINENGEAAEDDSEAVAALAEAKRRLFELCDFMFGGNMSEAFFGSMHPFSPVNGAFYCENAIEAVGNFISAQFDAETVKISKRMESYMPKGSKESRRRR